MAVEFDLSERQAYRYLEGASQLDRPAIGQQLAAVADNLEPAKFKGYGIFGRATHSPDCSA